MALQSSIGVRLDPDIKARLEKVTSATGMSAGKIIRTALEQYLDKIAREGGVYMPITGRSDLVSALRVGEAPVSYNFGMCPEEKTRPRTPSGDDHAGASKPASPGRSGR
jgi:antitoxin component of RelBE/YafQ-DinJ toxin-antitoxin module